MAHRYALALTLSLIACAPPPPRAPSPSSPAAWTDPSPHQARFVTVAEGVTLEVLDWGGEGPALIFLTGLGDSAHIFDDFAPLLRDRFHVYAVTRRGFGASSHPPKGYDPDTLGKDLLGVLRELGIAKASFAGHSIAGEELTWLGIHAPARVEKLVYLDAAYDRAARRESSPDAPKSPPPPEPTAADKASIAAYSAYVERVYGLRMPEAEIRATCVFDAAGRYVGDRTPEEVEGALIAATVHPDYARVEAPVLAIYMILESTDQMVTPALWRAMSEADREKVRARLAYQVKVLARDRQQLRQGAPRARVVEIPGAHHYVFVSHREVVLQEMRGFLLGSEGSLGSASMLGEEEIIGGERHAEDQRP